MNIRKATSQDLDAVAQIYGDIHTEIEAGRLSVGWIRSIYPTIRTAEAALERDDLFVAEDGGEIVGAAIINRRQEEAYAGAAWNYAAPPERVMVLHTLVIAPKHFGKGFGPRFVEYYEDYARSHGCSVLRLDTNVINLRAKAMYIRLGYTAVEAVPCDFNGLPNIRLLLLEKDLTV